MFFRHIWVGAQRGGRRKVLGPVRWRRLSLVLHAQKTCSGKTGLSGWGTTVSCSGVSGSPPESPIDVRQLWKELRRHLETDLGVEKVERWFTSVSFLGDEDGVVQMATSFARSSCSKNV